MHFTRLPNLGTAVATLLFSAAVHGQTYTKCNPLQQTCPADLALGKSMSASLTSQSSDFTGSGGTISYGSDGATLTVAKQGDAPTLESNWYIMFGRVEVTMKAAPGTGIVSSFVMQSDDLDEIDLEWLGGDSSQVQSNYFGKGITGGYDRGAFHPDPTSQSAFNTYTVDWSSEQVVWQINGQTVRVLTPAQAGNQYPQTPMQIKIGAWAGGDPSNAPGTISWAGGQTDYSAGPFSMVVQSVAVTDYSTGSKYSYGDMSGTWQSIVAADGAVYSGAAPNGVSTANVPTMSSTSGQPVPFEGTHAGSSSSYVTPTIYPWVGGQTTGVASAAASCYTGRPAGWTCSDNGKVLPPSSAVPSHPASTLSPSQASPSVAPSSGDDQSTITTAPTPSITKVPQFGGGVGPVNITTSLTSADSTTLATNVASSVTEAAPSAFTGAAMALSGDRLAAALGCLAGGLAFFL